jgi:HAD superfamily hydrolase (TIGR01549 family)
LRSLQAIIFFDLDNTLVEIENSHRFFDNIIVDVFKQECIPAPTQEQRNQLWRNSDYKQLLKSWNFPDHVLFWKSFDVFDLQYRKDLYRQGKLKTFNDVIPTLKKLIDYEGVYLILITNSSQDITQFELETFGLNRYFNDVIILGDSQDDCKPNPKRILESLNSISNNFKFSREHVFIVGDSPFDISAGKNANIKSILIKRWEKSHKEWTDSPDYTITNLNQLISII